MKTCLPVRLDACFGDFVVRPVQILQRETKPRKRTQFLKHLAFSNLVARTDFADALSGLPLLRKRILRNRANALDPFHFLANQPQLKKALSGTSPSTFLATSLPIPRKMRGSWRSTTERPCCLPSLARRAILHRRRRPAALDIETMRHAWQQCIKSPEAATGNLPVLGLETKVSPHSMALFRCCCCCHNSPPPITKQKCVCLENAFREWTRRGFCSRRARCVSAMFMRFTYQSSCVDANRKITCCLGRTLCVLL